MDIGVDLRQRTHLVNTIITGIYFYRIDNIVYCIKYPSIKDIAYSEFLYTEAIDKYKFRGWFTEQEHQVKLINQGLLDADFANKLKQIEHSIDNFKVQLFLTINPAEAEQVKKKIEIMRKNAANISKPLNLIVGKTVEDVALSIKQRHLLENSLYDTDMNKLYNIQPNLLEKLTYKIYTSMLEHETVRMLARNDPWKTHWSLSKPNPFVEANTIQWNNSQKTIAVYSNLYDSIYESPDCPSDEVVEDDDKMDGWLIYQRQKRNKDKLESEKESFSKKHADAQEVYVFAPNKETAQKIDNWNSPQSKQIKHDRIKQIKDSKTGVVKESELRDVQQGLKMQQHRAFTQSVKNKNRKG